MARAHSLARRGAGDSNTLAAVALVLAAGFLATAAATRELSEIDAFDRNICGLRKVPVPQERNERPPAAAAASARVSAGFDSVRGEFPWFVHLVASYEEGEHEDGETAYTEFSCGGAIIHADLVLTAAHCVRNPFHDLAEPVEIIVQAGLSNTSSGAGVQAVRAEASCAPSGYRGPHGRLGQDLALLRLARPLRYTKFVQPACLHDLDLGHPPQRLACVTAGLGEVDDSSHEPAAILQGLPLNECTRSGAAGTKRDELCMVTGDYARHPGSTCSRDAGGGVFCLKQKRGKQFYLAGVLSREPGECAAHKPGSTKVSDLFKQEELLVELFHECGATPAGDYEDEIEREDEGDESDGEELAGDEEAEWDNQEEEQSDNLSESEEEAKVTDY